MPRNNTNSIFSDNNLTSEFLNLKTTVDRVRKGLFAKHYELSLSVELIMKRLDILERFTQSTLQQQFPQNKIVPLFVDTQTLDQDPEYLRLQKLFPDL